MKRSVCKCFCGCHWNGIGFCENCTGQHKYEIGEKDD
jgi:hypothetical protein